MKITIFLFDGVTALDPIGVYDSLSRLPDRDIVFVSATGEPVSTGDQFLKLHCTSTLADIDRTDVLLVPGGNGDGLRACMGDTALKAEFTRLDRDTTITGSFCTGSLILAGAGLLRGRQATTNWRAKDYLGKLGATWGRYIERAQIYAKQLGTAAG
jgi:putative intracellular protease/amidase